MITVIRFTAPRCQPCKTLAPLFAALQKQYEGRAVFKTVDVDEDRTLAEQYAIRSVPTVVFLDENGETSGRLVGVKPQQDYIDSIDIRVNVEEHLKKYD